MLGLVSARATARGIVDLIEAPDILDVDSRSLGSRYAGEGGDGDSAYNHGDR